MRNTAAHPSHDQADAAGAGGRPVVLVGMMGVGKTTIGRRLARTLGCGFVDADEEIENAAGRPVSDLFAAHGEAAFRDGERRVIARLLGECHGVIATGGGAFADPETRRLILASGVAVWLDCDIETLVARTARRSTRPLLHGRDARAVLVDLGERRRAAYAEAPFRVETGDVSHDGAVARILRVLGR